ncbi:MAG: histidine phosphatase family protein [Kiritimatiellae bacterium]|nr:histidine phosphatase family protein [Kiritimatiellia bacterium]
MKIYFLRHGRTEWNANNRIQGSNEKIDLDDEGVKQAEGVTEGFLRAGLEFDRIYSSPYRRAMHTAEIVCAKTGGSPVSDGRIREICFGEYEGTPFFEAGFSDDNIRAAFEDPEKYVPRGGETYPQVLARVRDFLERELKPLEGKCEKVLAVAHGGVLHAVVTLVLGLDVSRFWEGRQRNCCVHEIGLENGSFTLLERNADYASTVSRKTIS